MKKIHFIGGEKGGVGKSFTARLLAQYYVDNQQSFVGFDSDQSHQTFTRFYEGFTTPISVTQYESLDKIIDAAEHYEHDIIVDLAAQTFDNLTQWIEDSAALDLFESIDYEVYFWHVSDGGVDSMNLLGKALQQLSHSNVKIVIVQNGGRGHEFENFTQSPIYREAISANAMTLFIEKLHPVLAGKIDFNNLSFWAAANNGDLLTRVEKFRIKTWIEKNYTQLQSIVYFPRNASPGSSIPRPRPVSNTLNSDLYQESQANNRKQHLSTEQFS